MTQVYHLVPHNLEGQILYPLNQLKNENPALYQAHVSKYEGREFLLTTNIPLLDCLWNDVLHFSPVHPAKIRDTMLALGQAWQAKQAFVIDTKAMNFTAQNTVFYFAGKTLKERLYEPFQIGKLETMRELPDDTLAHYKHCIEEKIRPLLFAHVPHVLYRGTIRITDLPRIQID